MILLFTEPATESVLFRMGSRFMPLSFLFGLSVHFLVFLPAQSSADLNKTLLLSLRSLTCNKKDVKLQGSISPSFLGVVNW